MCKVITKENGTFVTSQGLESPVSTAKGWELLIRWRDKSTTWVPLSHAKESNPVDVAEFAKAKGIDSEPAFAWWVPCTLKKRDVIIGKVTARARRTSHKHGVEIPRSVEHAHESDKANGNTFWRDATQKEMCNVGVAFQI